MLRTPAYFQPEVINQLPYGMTVYLFSCCVLFYIEVFGTLRFGGNAPLQGFDAISCGRLGFPHTRLAVVWTAACDLYCRLMDDKPSQPPTAWGLLES